MEPDDLDGAWYLGCVALDLHLELDRQLRKELKCIKTPTIISQLLRDSKQDLLLGDFF